MCNVKGVDGNARSTENSQTLQILQLQTFIVSFSTFFLVWVTITAFISTAQH